MRTLLVIVLLSLAALPVAGASRVELRDKLVATGDYLEVGQPVAQRKKFAYERLTAVYYAIGVLAVVDDSLVVRQETIRVWVIDDGELNEAAYFVGADPTLPPVTVDGFGEALRVYMEAEGIDGYMERRETDSSAVVVEYVPGVEPGHTTSRTLRVVRTGEKTWERSILE